MDNLLQNYYLFLSKVEAWLKNLDSTLAVHMQCRPGCISCCKNFTLFPVEAWSILNYIKENKIEISQIDKSYSSDNGRQRKIANKDKLYTKSNSPDDACVFLSNKGLCRIYNARPLICRTHGYPILVKRYPENSGSNVESRIDYCPENFQDRLLTEDYLKREHLIDIEHLNTVLVSINSLFIKQCRELIAQSTGLIADKESNRLNLLNLFCNIIDNVEKVKDAGRAGNGRLSFYDIISI